MEIDRVILEDDKIYNVVASLNVDNQKYLCLSYSKDISDICIRRIDGDYLVGLEENEYNKVINEFKKKYQDLFD